VSKLQLSTQSWSTQSLFILAAVGSAVGLGNLWKFPYITGENGGGAFVLVYLACIILIGLPVLISELALGRAGKANPPQAMANLAKASNASNLWRFLGVNGLLAGILILSFYAVIAGWALSYFVDSLQGDFLEINAEAVGDHFSGLLASPLELLFWHTLIMLITLFIVSRGVKQGLEKAINFMMPGLILILLVLLGYATTTGSLGQSFSFLFTPDFTKLTWESVLIAMGHAFFTLSVGMGVMMVYGSYVKSSYSIVKAGMWIAFLDTLIALIAGLVIFAIVFANGLEAGSGPGLLFQTLPVAFGQMTGGWFFGTLFFALVVMAALSSAISLIEPAVSWVEQNWSISRMKATWGLGFMAWLVGIGTVLSFNHWSDVHFLGDKTFFDSLDFITANIMLPLGGLFMAVFVAWTMKPAILQQEVSLSHSWLNLFLFDLRYLTTVAVMVVFATNLVESTYVGVLVTLTLMLYSAYAYKVQKTQ